MKVRRSLGGGGLARSGAIHAGGMWMLLADGPPPAQARGMLAVGVTLVEGAGAAGGGEQVSAAVAERIQPAEAQRVASEQAMVEPSEEVPPVTAEMRIAEATTPAEPPPAAERTEAPGIGRAHV